MCSANCVGALGGVLQAHPLRWNLVYHPIFVKMKSTDISRNWVTVVIGQWWHPLHYFPTFLGQCVASLPDVASQSAVARILFQETGEGRPARAHEQIYIETMTNAGFAHAEIACAPPLPETTRLIADYRDASGDRYTALGCLAATEFADLAMVSGIGASVRRVTGVADLEWVRIHEQQEPDHVKEADHALLESFDREESALIVAAAERSWRAWIGFFDALAAAGSISIQEPGVVAAL